MSGRRPGGYKPPCCVYAAGANNKRIEENARRRIMVWIARYFSWLMNPMAFAVGIALQRRRRGAGQEPTFFGFDFDWPRWYSHGHTIGSRTSHSPNRDSDTCVEQGSGLWSHVWNKITPNRGNHQNRGHSYIGNSGAVFRRSYTAAVSAVITCTYFN
jgi:hypothetical protein